MKNQETTKLALKLAGIYIIFQAIMYLPTVIISIKMITNPSSDIKMTSITIILTFILLLAFGLWLFISNNPKIENKENNSSEIINIGLVILGILLFALAVPELPLIISKIVNTYLSSNQNKIMGVGNQTDSILELTGLLLQMGIGATLFLKAKQISKLIK